MDYNDSKVNDGEIIMEIKYYSIKEAAELLSMTKPGIRYRLKLLSIPLEKDAFGRVVLSEGALQWIRDGKKPESEAESGEKSEKVTESNPENTGKNEEAPESEAEKSGKNSKESESEGAAVVMALAALQRQLEVKDEQIKELTEQLHTVTEALAAAQRTLEGSQALHAHTMQQLQAATEEDQPEEEPEADTDPEPHKKRSLLDRILGRV